ncbi:hypothetical protein BROUX41_002315 [Berkeleyomyces rouxiae]|uniref:uncharacterized protein n=1 Tax=Berkeleyomyces rouxiae TaxID=2035830 RepID=UPI003B81A4AB
MDRPLRRSARRASSQLASGSQDRNPASSSQSRASSRPTGSSLSARATESLPQIYREMLVEVASDAPERPRKRPMTRRQHLEAQSSERAEKTEGEGGIHVPKKLDRNRGLGSSTGSSVQSPATRGLQNEEKEYVISRPSTAPKANTPSVSTLAVDDGLEDDDEDGLHFEDALPAPVVQTMIRDSDDESSDSDSDDEVEISFENMDFENLTQAAAPPGAEHIELNLSSVQQQVAADSPAALLQKPKRKPLNKEQKQHRMEAHRMHLLCLIWHCSLRNHWCNDRRVQSLLKRHLTQRTRDYLCPKKKMLPFAQTESIKRGLGMAGEMWKINYNVTERGMKRALWSLDPEDLASYEPPEDLETCPRKSDFQETAKSLSGSRDVGAQLYCAFLRAAGIRTRLVCSLQVLPFGSGGPSMATTKPKPSKVELRRREMQEKKRRAMDLYKQPEPTPVAGFRRRALASAPSPSPSSSSDFASASSSAAASASQPAPERESPHPVYWVEVLDKTSQKWIPADPIVTKTFARTKPLEPPLSDRDNLLTYVIAFEDDGTFRDVTHRYAKAFKAKTRKLRIEYGMPDGQVWWQRVIKHYTDPEGLDALDFAENVELQDYLSRESMPRNISDFRGHPEYVLTRHLKRNQVLKPGSQTCGTVAPGSKAPLEHVYPREDVRTVHSRDKWFRLGRQVRPTERPSKTLIRRAPKGRNFGDDSEVPETDTAIPVYTEEQTDLFQHPPVLDGRVPRNKFGNLEIYVPNMIPAGGAYVAHNKAVKAAFLLGIDYAPAVSGFEFRGRHGTAVMKGAVVAAEHAEAMDAVLAGFDDLQASALEEKKRRLILKAWTRFLRGLRIRAKIWEGVDEEKEKQEARNRIEDRRRDEQRAQKKLDSAKTPEVPKETDYELEEVSDHEYIIEEDDEDEEAEEDHDMGGGFIVE